MDEVAPECWSRCKAGDQDARREIIEQYLPLTRYVASKMHKRLPSSVEFDDLVAYGAIGLIDAVEKFDPEKGVKFGTYAVNRIRGAIIDELRSLDWVPRSVRTKARNVENATHALGHELGRAPTNEELAEHLGVSDVDLISLLEDAAAPAVMPLEAQVRSDSEEHTFGDTIVDQAAEDPLSSRIDGEVAEAVARVVADLDERQRTILALYCVEELTLSEIGDVLGVTESRVCQMHTRTVASIQDRLERRGAGIVPS